MTRLDKFNSCNQGFEVLSYKCVSFDSTTYDKISNKEFKALRFIVKSKDPYLYPYTSHKIQYFNIGVKLITFRACIVIKKDFSMYKSSIKHK